MPPTELASAGNVDAVQRIVHGITCDRWLKGVRQGAWRSSGRQVCRSSHASTHSGFNRMARRPPMRA
jgi:hypothetical protein